MEKLPKKIPVKKVQPDNSPTLLPSRRKPPAAGNRAFRLHNRLMFSRTSTRKEIGRANKI